MEICEVIEQLSARVTNSGYGSLNSLLQALATAHAAKQLERIADRLDRDSILQGIEPAGRN